MSIICSELHAHRLKRDALVGLQRADDAAGVLLWKKALGHDNEQIHVQADRGDEDQQHQQTVAQRPGQRVAVTDPHPLEQARPALRSARSIGLEEQRAQHRRGGERNHQRHQDRDRQRDGELAEQPAENAAHQQDRQEHHDQRQADRKHGEADLARAAKRRLQARHAFFHVAGDVFHHHDRVVDHEAGGDGQRHQRENVEAVAEQIHHAEGAEDRYRHRDARDDGGADLAQEQKHHDGDQHHRQHQRQFGVVQRGADRGAAIDGDTDVHVGRHGRFQMRQLRLHGVDGLDDVGVRLTVEDDQNRRLAVGHAEIAIVLNGVGDLGDVGEADRRAVAIGDHQRRVVGGNVRLVVGVDLKTPVAVVDRALRAVGVGRGKRGAHVLEPDAVIVQRLRVELDAHRRKARAADIDVADAAQLRQPLRQDVARGVVHLALRHRLRGQRQDHDRRVGRIDFAVGRIARQVGRQVGARGVDRRLRRRARRRRCRG